MSTQEAQAAALVRQGFQAQQSGDTAGATAAFEAALRLHPAEPNALQLLGLLAGKRGDQVAAEQYLRRSLQAADAQPHVWNNLGNVLDRTQRRDEAERCYARAAELAGNYADALYNLARLQHARGADEAGTTLQRALSQPGGSTPAALQLKAQIESDQGQLDAALITLDDALKRAPARAALHHNRAVLLQRLHRPAQALQGHDQAVALGADSADAHYNRGNTLHSLGRTAEAVAAYQRALARDSGHVLALFDLARLRWTQGETDFDAGLRQAVLERPADRTLAQLHGQLLWRAERPADAAAVFTRALQHATAPTTPAEARDTAALHDGLARCLVRLGQLDAGLAAHHQALAGAPHDADLHSHHAASLLVARRPAAALAAAEAACAAAPHNQQALAMLGLCWRVLDDPRADWLCDPARLVGSFDLAPPDGWPDMATFNAALATELAALHGRDREAPVDQTLRHGTQTLGRLFEQGHPLVDALKLRIAQAVDKHIAQLPADHLHPFLGRRTAHWHFTDSWSSRLRRQGFHIDHVHPHGWLSSCYYVALPPATGDATQTQGWIRFGAPDFDAGLARPVQHVVQPQAGRLLLFPSMLWHGTVPFDDDAERLTVAFDVVPG